MCRADYELIVVDRRLLYLHWQRSLLNKQSLLSKWQVNTKLTLLSLCIVVVFRYRDCHNMVCGEHLILK